MKKVFLVSGLLCCLLVVFTADRTFALVTVRILYSSVNPHALLISIAEKRGLYAKYGLSSVLVYVPGGSTAIQALLSGDADVAQLTGAPGVTANLRGADILYIAMSDDRMGYQLVTRPEIKRVADLKGKRFGISRFGSSSEFGVKALLKKVNVNPKDVTILQIGNETERLVALKSSNIDASVFNAPFGSEAKKFNFNILADAAALGIPYFNTGICGSAKLLLKNEAKILNFMRAYVESIKIFKNEPEYTLKALAQFTRVSDQEALKESYEYNKGRIPDVPYPSLTAMQAVIEPLIEADPKLAKVDARNYISDRFLKKLEDEGFVKKLMGR
ncbi:MAG: ABC transporter substrate-binding protein [Deltaproteobacteria bacterium]|nr:MAG: ABC transporter substrate-binding protein [Deltaproteobacteria bacterium]